MFIWTIGDVVGLSLLALLLLVLGGIQLSDMWANRKRK